MFSPLPHPVNLDQENVVKAINRLEKSVAVTRSNADLTEKQKTQILNIISSFEEALEPLKREGTIIDVSVMELLKTLRKECPWVTETLQKADDQGPLYSATHFLLNSTDVGILSAEEADSSSEEKEDEDPTASNVRSPLPTPNLEHTSTGNTPLRPALGTPRKPKAVTFAAGLGLDDDDLLATNKCNTNIIELFSETNKIIDLQATAEQVSTLTSLVQELKAENNLKGRIQELEKSKAALEARVAIYEKAAGASLITLFAIGGLFGLAYMMKSDR